MPDIESVPIKSVPWTHTRARIANYRLNHPDDEVPAELYGDHAVARIADFVQRTVDAAPELTSEQRDRLAILLRAPAATESTDTPTDTGSVG